MTIEAYPLHWPEGWKRRTGKPHVSRYQVTFARARDELLHELRLMGCTQVVISSNIPLRRDGLPYANLREPEDSAVAVYWVDRDGAPRTIACDYWETVRDNLRAIGLTVSGLRVIERSGATDLLERAYMGFARLPATTKKPWRQVMAYDPGAHLTLYEVKSRYRQLARERHPDRSGSEAWMTELNEAFEEAKRELG